MSLPSGFPANLDETIVVPSRRPEATAVSLAHGPVALVSGTGAGLEHETESLLRVRLRAAAVIMLASVAAFFVRDLFVDDAPFFWLRPVTLLALVAAVGLLTSRRTIALRNLRRLEVGLFSLISVYLGVYQYQLVLIKAREGNPIFELAAVKSCVLYFFAVMLLYGTLIPNTWQRAARVLVPMSLVSFVVMGLLRVRSSAVESLAGQIGTFEQVSDHFIMMGLGLVSSLYGAHIIYSLRVEAYEARKMGQYHLKQLIGSGGMGEVYLAEHSLLKRPCAIKLIRPGSQADPLALARFEREVRTTAKLSHWNTIDIYDYGRTEDGTFYYVMELLSGASLADLVKRHGPLPAGRVIHLLRQTCRALHEAHAAGLIHRDIKPANIFAARIGGICDVAKLLDFGLVKQTAEEHSAQLSQDGSFSGSPLYMAPEQATAKDGPDARSDIYSLGATAYFALTGRAPFEGSNPIQVIISHARDPVVPPSRVRPGIPADLEQVVLRSLAKRPDERFREVLQLERALAACGDAGKWTDEMAESWWREIDAARPVPERAGSPETAVPTEHVTHALPSV